MQRHAERDCAGPAPCVAPVLQGGAASDVPVRGVLSAAPQMAHYGLLLYLPYVDHNADGLSYMGYVKAPVVACMA